MPLEWFFEMSFIATLNYVFAIAFPSVPIVDRIKNSERRAPLYIFFSIASFTYIGLLIYNPHRYEDDPYMIPTTSRILVLFKPRIIFDKPVFGT